MLSNLLIIVGNRNRTRVCQILKPVAQGSGQPETFLRVLQNFFVFNYPLKNRGSYLLLIAGMCCIFSFFFINEDPRKRFSWVQMRKEKLLRRSSFADINIAHMVLEPGKTGIVGIS